MPHKQKLRPEEKEKIVRRYLEGEVSISGAAEEFSVGRTSVQEWIVQYKAEGIAAFLPHKCNRKYSPELKLQAIQDYLSGGGSLLEVSKKYGLRNKRQLQDWMKVYNAHEDFNSVKFSGGGSYMQQGRDTTQEELE